MGLRENWIDYIRETILYKINKTEYDKIRYATIQSNYS